MSHIIRIGALALAFTAAPFAAAFADRAPTAEEEAIIGDILYHQGFNSWGKIEFDDDGQWEVENAIDQNGTVRDLTLDTAFMIIDAEDDSDGGEAVGIHPVD